MISSYFKNVLRESEAKILGCVFHEIRYRVSEVQCDRAGGFFRYLKESTAVLHHEMSAREYTQGIEDLNLFLKLPRHTIH
jgi:hypothetical protein